MRRKLIVITMLTSGIALVLSWAGLATYEILSARARMVRELATTAAMAAHNSAAGLTSNDAEDVEHVLAGFAEHPQIVSACVYDKTGRPFATYRRSASDTVCPALPAEDTAGHVISRGRVDLFRGISSAGERIGTLHVARDLSPLGDLGWRYAGTVGVLMFACALVALVIAARLQTIISRPIRELAEVAERVATNEDYSIRAVKRTEDELGRLIDGFNAMLTEIQQREAALQAAREDLEQRVEERTRALATENAERRRVEHRLVESEELHRQMATNGSDLMYVWHIGSGRVDVYGQVDQILGYRMGDLPHTFSGWVEMLHPDERDEVVAALRAACESGRPLHKDQRLKRKDGTWMHLTHRGRPIYGPGGVPMKFVGACTDITARKKFEAELAYERDLLRALLDGSEDYIYFKDADSRLLRCSRNLRERYGLATDEEVVGRSDFDFYRAEDARAFRASEQEIMRSGKPIVGVVERQAWKSGEIAWTLTTKMPFRDTDGQVIGTFGISKDITAIKEAEAKLEEAHRQLLETSRMAGMAEVATGVLHNVGNALNSVNVSTTLIAERIRASRVTQMANVVSLLRDHESGLGAFLERDPKGRQLPAYLMGLAAHLTQERDTLLGELDALRKSIEHMKDIVSMQQGYAKVSGITESIAADDLVEDALRMNSASLARHGIQVVRDFARGLPRITVQRHKVLQILVNVISNAKHACQQSASTDKRLTVRIDMDAQRVRFCAIDNGVGIPAENLTRIFSHGFTTRQDGHGFGLHSGALAAREMGGALLVHSDGPGTGATFTLDLPLRPASQSPAEMLRDRAGPLMAEQRP